MDDEIEGAVIAVRADTAAFAREVTAMKAELEGGLGEGAAVAGRRIEGALVSAIRTGRIGFEDLRRTALGVLSDIASAAIHSGLDAIFAGGGKSGGGLAGLAGQLLAGLLGAPGRATGGPVVGGRAYRVGERGPEL
ncbi:MAG: tail tape measure protein, partial [Sphingomonadaceae bacterium]|nr:tail tape measure protein [Sphingomonadaceae bacterium]